ncbi:MAG TPA: NAD(+)/NADH kinase [Thermoflexia bacterium]|nr:NAD(+)/NADH kinase [Thermoflexia bacterium]
MQKIGLFYNDRLDRALPLAQEISSWLTERGVESWQAPRSAPPQGSQLVNSDLLLTLGGDGTILRAMALTAPLGVPVLGVNLGRVGFLTTCEPDNWPETLTQVLAGRGRVEERLMLRVTLVRDGDVISQDMALNDAVLSRGALARTVRLRAAIDRAQLAEYVADGLIIATATGSTAYSYAVGGPVLSPWSKNILLVPVAPHLSLDRPLVLDSEAQIAVSIQTRTPGMLTVDGHLVGQLLDGDSVRVTRSALQARFLRLRSRGDFYRTLVARLTPRN